MNEDTWLFINPISSLSDVNQRVNVLSRVIGKTTEDNLWLIKQSKWIAVPTESGDHFAEDDRKLLLKALLDNNYEEVTAVLLESLENFPKVFVFPLTSEAIEEFNRKCGHFRFALYAGKPDWMILCTKLDYLVVAGESSFVEEFLGCSFKEELLNFEQFILESTYESQPWRNRLRQVLERLKFNYPNASPGMIVKL